MGEWSFRIRTLTSESNEICDLEVQALLLPAYGNQATSTASSIRDSPSRYVFPNLAGHTSSFSVGYSAPGMEKVVQHLYDADELAKNRKKTPDVKESFEVGREHDEVMPNILLPDGILPGFNDACLDFFWVCFSFLISEQLLNEIFVQACYDIEKIILQALALGLGLPDDHFVKVHTIPDNQLRLLHYPRSFLSFTRCHTSHENTASQSNSSKMTK